MAAPDAAMRTERKAWGLTPGRFAHADHIGGAPEITEISWRSIASSPDDGSNRSISTTFEPA